MERPLTVRPYLYGRYILGTLGYIYESFFDEK